MPYRGFVASRATLVLAPTNLHMQWLAEIEKLLGASMFAFVCNKRRYHDLQCIYIKFVFVYFIIQYTFTF